MKAELEAERSISGKERIQERLSFIKMEYFLYTFSEAHRFMVIIQKLSK